MSLSGCGRTAVFKPASAGPANISSTTQQHSESLTHTHARINGPSDSCRVRQNCESLTTLGGPTQKKLHRQVLTISTKSFKSRDKTPK